MNVHYVMNYIKKLRFIGIFFMIINFDRDLSVYDSWAMDLTEIFFCILDYSKTSSENN